MLKLWPSHTRKFVIPTALIVCSTSVPSCTHLTYGFAVNPLDDSPQVRETGQLLYMKHCSSCHGAEGLGDGPDAKALSHPPTALTTAQRDWSDGVFQIRMISEPENDMPSFKDTLTEDERWSIIRYVRSLDVNTPLPPKS